MTRNGDDWVWLRAYVDPSSVEVFTTAEKKQLITIWRDTFATERWAIVQDSNDMNYFAVDLWSVEFVGHFGRKFTNCTVFANLDQAIMACSMTR